MEGEARLSASLKLSRDGLPMTSDGNVFLILIAEAKKTIICMPALACMDVGILFHDLWSDSVY